MKAILTNPECAARFERAVEATLSTSRFSVHLDKQSHATLELIVIGFLLSVLGIALPFLMLIHIISSTFFLNFFSFIASMTWPDPGYRRRLHVRSPASQVDRVGTVVRRQS